MRNSPCLLLLCAASLLSGAQTPPQPQTPPPPTLDQSLNLVTVGAPAISPDGLHVVYETSRTDWDDNAFETDLWLTSAADPHPHRLTAPLKSANAASFSPDGRWIAFLSDRPGSLPKTPAGKPQIYIASAGGGEGSQLTRVETGVTAFRWAPGSRSLVFSATDPETQAQKDRKESFGDYHIVHADYRMTHLWAIDVPDDPGVTHPTPVRLTEGAFSVDGFDIAPNGEQVAFSAKRDPDLISGFTSDIYTVTLAGHTVKKIVDTAGPDTDPLWSPDSREIAYLTSNAEPNFFYTDNRIALVPAAGGAKPVILDAAFDEDAGLTRWTPAGLFFTARQGVASRLFRLDPATKTITPISPDRAQLSAPALTPDGQHLAYRGASANRLPEIYTTSLAAWSPVQLTQAGGQLTAFARSTREVVRWKSSDGQQIEGILEKPANFQPGTRYPLLVIIHGGPTGIDTPALAPDRYYPAERFLARGALILRPNYRGSAGYGAKFRALNVRNLGVGDYADVIGGVDALIAQGLVDPKRVGAMGWSEGGYISAFITASSNRFAAVSVGAGISDWATYYYNTDITPFTRQYLGATPQTDPEIYRKTSPISYISHAQTPTLIQQGSVDRRVPVPDSYELRQALEDRNLPVKMVLYEGFGHPINKPKQQRAVMTENELWFNHYLWNDPLPPDLAPTTKAKPDPKDAKEPAAP